MKGMGRFLLVAVIGAFITTIVDSMLGINFILLESVSHTALIIHIVMYLVWGAYLYKYGNGVE